MLNKRKSTVLLEHHLKQLRLPTMLKEYPLLAKSCSQEKCDYPTYLLRLCEKELADRQRRAMDRRIKAAKFPLLKTIDSFDFAAQKSVNEPLIRGQRKYPADWQQWNWQDASCDIIGLCRVLSGL
jgi:DNA replication protein DnaC